MSSLDQKYLLIICLLTIIFTSSFVFAGGIDKIHILKISASDQKAVIKTPDGNMTIIKVGDPIGETATVVEIADNRVVLKHEADDGPEMIIIRLVNGKQTIESIRKSNLKQSVVPMSPMSPN